LVIRHVRNLIAGVLGNQKTKKKKWTLKFQAKMKIP
jgi:hypothetical protein